MNGLTRTLLAVVLPMLLVSIALSAETAEPSFGPSDRALTKGSNRVWYDSSDKEFVFPSAATLQAAEDDLQNRHRRLIDNSVSNTPSGWSEWLGKVFYFLSQSVHWILYFLLALALVFLTVFLWRVIDPVSYSRWRNRPIPIEDAVREQTKIVDLPFNIEVPLGGLLGQAEAFRMAGDYSRAIIYLFSHVLVELDDADCIRLQRGKTNRVYLRELRNDPRLAELHRYMMQVFEAVFFGRYEANREECERCWELHPTIERAIEEAKQRRVNATYQTEEAPRNTSEVTGALKQGTIGLVWFVLVGFAGCDSSSRIPTENYGDSNHSSSRKSVSGLSVFRALCEERRLRTFELKSLSHRSRRLDTIVWAPKDFRHPNDKEMAWFDEWMTYGEHRTLIYIGRDYSPASHYWQRAAESASDADRRTFRLRQAYADVKHDSARLLVGAELVGDWFLQRFDPGEERLIDRFEGPWSEGVSATDTHIYLRGTIKPNSDPRTVELSDVDTDPSTTYSTLSDSLASDKDTEIELETIEYGVPTIANLLTSSDANPIVSSMTYEDWGTSRLVLVANGSLLMNEGMTIPGNRALASRLITEFSPSGMVGFLSSEDEIWIRQPWDEKEPKGFELLRVWPLSLISIQGLFLGFIALLALFPIFGRPQRLPVPSTTDFGKHIESLGDLLLRSRDRNYALQCIATYFREVRRDTVSSWASVAPPPLDTPLKSNPSKHVS